MQDKAYYNVYGEELENLLALRYAPVAFKMLEREEDIPDGAVRPKRDLGCHYALCQAIALVRRQRKHIAMLNEDQWCMWALIGLGTAPFHEGMEAYESAVCSIFFDDPKKGKAFYETSFPRFEYGKYIGLVMAPLDTANFEPDLVMIYAKPAQLRSLLMGAKYKLGALIRSEFDAIDSCIYATVPALKTGEYRITVPDPGEYERALTDEDEMIFTIPIQKLADLVEGLKAMAGFKLGYKGLKMEMKADFTRPKFYDDLAKSWGLDRGEVWTRQES